MTQDDEDRELSQIWIELHDVEHRQAAVEDRMTRAETVSSERDRFSELRHRLTWDVLPLTLGLASTTVAILTALKVL